MLERYFVRAESVERIRSSWIGEVIEQYVCWMTEGRYAVESVKNRVPVLLHFGEYARRQGARTVQDLPAHVEAFAHSWAQRRKRRVRTRARRRHAAQQVRSQVQQMLRVARVAAAADGGQRVREPFQDSAPGFFPYLREERGLRESSLHNYRYPLRHLEAYLRREGRPDPGRLSPRRLSAFVIEQSRRVSRANLRGQCYALRGFLRYLHREGVVARDLSGSVEAPLVYRLSSLPRSLPWEEVPRLLGCVDRSLPVGRRDYAILLLLLSYGLRAREVTALRLDDLDWHQEKLRIRQRKAGHSTAYPLSAKVGEALLEYLQRDRPRTEHRQVFLCLGAPCRPLAHYSVSDRASLYLRRAGLHVPRAGSHTLRHTCVQRLVETGFSLPQVGDYVGHRAAASTEVYSKISIEALREVACGDGEAIL